VFANILNIVFNGGTEANKHTGATMNQQAAAVVAATHTSGPWTFTIHERTTGLARGAKCAWVHGPAGHIEVGVEDARLIAAAPKLLGALQYFMTCIDNSAHMDNLRGGVMGSGFDMAYAAIAKATGATA
jgi:hypothetical protein